jgi:hypothetical protein
MKRGILTQIFLDAAVMVAGSDVHWQIIGYAREKDREFALLLC